LLYDKKRYEEAIENWETILENWMLAFSIAWRNFGMA